MAACPPLSNHKVTWPAPEGHPSKKERVLRPPPENRTCGCQCLHSFKTMEAMDTNTDWHPMILWHSRYSSHLWIFESAGRPPCRSSGKGSCSLPWPTTWYHGQWRREGQRVAPNVDSDHGSSIVQGFFGRIKTLVQRTSKYLLNWYSNQ